MWINRERMMAIMHRSVRWAREKVPPGVRAALGVVLIAGGLLGFLPILGFWMIPVGGALVALDIPPLRRRLLAWLERHERRRAVRPRPGPADPKPAGDQEASTVDGRK